MGVLGSPVTEPAVIPGRWRVPIWCAAAGYTAVVGFAVLHHEPWADEAQAWLLARDASLMILCTRLLGYEGTPGLWHSLLHLLIRLWVPYSGLNVVSGLLGLMSACLVLWHAPWPLALRLALPFTFYLCYQYAVIARSYTLLPVLLFACAILHKHAARRMGLLTVLLCLMAAVSAHGLALSLVIYLVNVPVWSARRKALLLSGFSYGMFVLLMVLTAWPRPDAAFVTHPNYSFNHAVETAAKALSGAFMGNWMLSLLVIGLSVPFLWRGKALIVFALSAMALCLLGSIVYSQVWHQGIVFLAWLYAIWIASYRVRPTGGVIWAMALVIAVQAFWSYRSIQYDWSNPYSGSAEAARYLRESGLSADKSLFAVGYACVGIQPYFPHNIFANVNGGAAAAYWDWSSSNHVNETGTHLRASRPDYVIVGYKGEFEHNLWTAAVTQGGYDLLKRFDGHTFWQTRVFEPESFDLYRRR